MEGNGIAYCSWLLVQVPINLNSEKTIVHRALFCLMQMNTSLSLHDLRLGLMWPVVFAKGKYFIGLRLRLRLRLVRHKYNVILLSHLLSF